MNLFFHQFPKTLLEIFKTCNSFFRYFFLQPQKILFNRVQLRTVRWEKYSFYIISFDNGPHNLILAKLIGIEMNWVHICCENYWRLLFIRIQRHCFDTVFDKLSEVLFCKKTLLNSIFHFSIISGTNDDRYIILFNLSKVFGYSFQLFLLKLDGAYS